MEICRGRDKIKMKDVHKEVLTGKITILEGKDRAGRPILLARARLHERANSTPLSIMQHQIYLFERAIEA